VSLASTSIADEGSPRQLHSSPDRSAHPAGRDLSSADKVRPTGSISFGALRRIAAGLARVQQPVPLDDASDAPRSVRLLATAFYDVWLITWPDGAELEPHDHGDVLSVVHVVKGELAETYSDRVKRSDPAIRILRQGSSTPADPSVVHALINRSGADATTLHVYSPPLVDITFFDLHSAGHCEALRSRAVVQRAAQATSKERAPSGSAPLTLVDP
jgi:predicted metal-dependent enzyme (double-stranded beta helix superfamily)